VLKFQNVVQCGVALDSLDSDSTVLLTATLYVSERQ